MQLLDEIAEDVAVALSPHGFALLQRARAAPDARRLARGRLVIQLTLDPRNGELDVSLTDAPTGIRVPFWLLGEITGDKQASIVGSTGVLSEADAPVASRMLTDTIGRYLPILLDWNDETAQRLSDTMASLSREGWKKQRLKDALAKAELCWASKRYAAYVELLAPFEPDLSAGGQKKLAIAQRRLRSEA